MSWITHQPAKNFASVLCISFLLSACGGGGSGGSSTSSNNNTETNTGTETPTKPAPQTEPEPQTNPDPQTEPPVVLPVFTSPATISVKENETEVLSISTALPATFTLTGGADQDKFNLNASSLSFNEAPNFEKTSDQNTDNTYEVEITATENGKSASQLLSVVVTNILPPVIFPASNGLGRTQLWTSDGTEQGTKLLKDIRQSGLGQERLINDFSSHYTPIEEKVFFMGNDGVSKELWVTDGTEEGTRIVKKTNSSGSSVSGYASFSSVVLNDELYFSASDEVHGQELWKTDGTEGGTTLIKDINPGIDSSYVSHLSKLGNNIAFSAISESGESLWISDGTSEGTQPILDHEGRNIEMQSKMISIGDKSFFSARVGFLGSTALWETNGTPSGTKPVVNRLYNMSKLTEFGTKLFFVADNIYVYDTVTKEDPYRLFETGRQTSGHTIIDDTLYFISNNTTLYKSDGTTEGTVVIAGSSVEGSILEEGDQLFSVNGKLLLNGRSAESTRQLWISNGTTEGTILLKDINPTGNNGSGISNFDDLTGLTMSSFFLPNGDKLFVAYKVEEGSELWKTNATEEGTTLVKDINPGPGSLFDGVPSFVIP